LEGQAQQPVEPETAMASRLYVCVRLVALLLLLAAVVQSFLDASHYYGADLRARVVGARAMLRGLDPYFLPMRADQPETLQDPFRYALQFSRCTYAPTLLWLYAPFANLVFTTQRWIWWCLEWTALLSSIYLLGQVMASSVVRNAYFLLARYFLLAAHPGGWTWNAASITCLCCLARPPLCGCAWVERAQRSMPAATIGGTVFRWDWRFRFGSRRWSWFQPYGWRAIARPPTAPPVSPWFSSPRRFHSEARGYGKATSATHRFRIDL